MADGLKIKLWPSSGQAAVIDVDVAKTSGTIKNMIENRSEDELREGIQLPTISLCILNKVLEYLYHHYKDDKSSEDTTEHEISPFSYEDGWDNDFIKVEQATLMELILAANYLDIPGLLHLCCGSVANMIKDKSPEQIRKTFNIKNDFTPEEEEQVRRENEWCEGN